jgi:hypothetical protein
MAQPTLVGVTSNTFHSSSGTITRTTAAGNCLLVGISLTDGTDSVSGVTDNLGNNINGSPVNQWEYLGGSNLGGSRLELWACLHAASITSITIALTSGGTGTQYVAAALAEYNNTSGVSTYGGLQVNSNQNTPSTYNTGHSQKYENQHTQINLTMEQPPTSSSSVIVGFFGMILSALPGDTQAFGIATSGTKQLDMNESSPYPNLAMLDNAVQGSDGELSVGVNQNQYIEGGDPNDYNYFGASTLQGLYVVLTNSLVLTHEPGFSDVSDNNFVAGQLARGFDLIKISENAAFGMARMEFFYGEYSNGQTVNLPVSPIDGYEYQRDECQYIWNVRSTVNPSSGWASGEEALWIANWYVTQATGAVFCEEWYSWVHADHPPIQSSDGILGVYTIATRQQTNLTLSVANPQYTDVVDTTFVAGTAYRQDILQAMNDNSKLAVVKAEVIYMGEHVNGDVIAQPVSPSDGLVYAYSQCKFIACPRWNTAGGSYTQPGNNSFLNNFTASIDANGNVTVTIQTWDPGNGVLTVSGAGRVAVFAICSRQTNYSTPGVTGIGMPYISTSTPSSQELGAIPAAFRLRNCATGTASSVTLQWYLGPAFTIPTGSPQVYAVPPYPASSAIFFPPAGGKGFNMTAQTGVMTNAGYTVQGFMDTFSQSSLPYTSLANQFKEVNPVLLLPGSPIPAGTLKQINDNIRESIVAVEFFGPTNYTNGQTVPTPTSPVDGYAYSRAELFYIATWEAFNATTSVRIIVGEGYVNITTGVVTTTLWELPSGGTGTAEGDGTLRVVVVGIRSGSGRTAGASTTTINVGLEGSDNGS